MPNVAARVGSDAETKKRKKKKYKGRFENRISINETLLLYTLREIRRTVASDRTDRRRSRTVIIGGQPQWRLKLLRRVVRPYENDDDHHRHRDIT